MAFKLLSVLSFIFLTISCSKEEPVYQPTNKADPYVLYSEAYKAFELNDFFNACLLYTSPSPRDGLLSRMPSSA